MERSDFILNFGLANYVLSMTFGNGLHYGIIAFEHYGADPMKRSIGNQMVSFISGCFIVHTVVYNSALTAYIWFGPLGSFFATTATFVRCFCAIALCLSFVEHILYRCLLAFHFKHAVHYNEDFVAWFLKCFYVIYVLCGTVVMAMFLLQAIW